MRSPTLFWRTFLLIVLLLVAAVAAWLQSFRVFEREPRARQVSQQLVSIVNITRAALLHSDPGRRRALLSDLADNEGIRVLLREDVDEARLDRADDEALKARGIVGGEELRSLPLHVRSRRRLVWLSLNIVLNLMGASVIAFYEETLQAVERARAESGQTLELTLDGEFGRGTVLRAVVRADVDLARIPLFGAIGTVQVSGDAAAPVDRYRSLLGVGSAR